MKCTDEHVAQQVLFDLRLVKQWQQVALQEHSNFLLLVGCKEPASSLQTILPVLDRASLSHERLQDVFGSLRLHSKNNRHSFCVGVVSTDSSVGYYLCKDTPIPSLNEL